MDGVTILNTNVSTYNAGEIIFGFFICALTCVVAVGTIANMIMDHDIFDGWIWALYIFLLALLVVAFVMGLAVIVDGFTHNETTYEVTIDDNVSMTEFMSTYEIVEQRGDIYVVKEIIHNGT